MNLDLGSHVKSSDGEDVGKVDRIVYEPDTLKVREFVVHKGFLLPEDRIISVHHVDHIDEDHTVHLDIPAEEVHDLPPFVAEQHVPVVMTSPHYVGPNPLFIVTREGSVPRDAVVLTHRSEVYDSEGKHIGHVDEVQYNEDGDVSAFIVDSGFIFAYDVRVPLTDVQRITHDRVDLRVTAAEAEGIER